MNIRHLITTQNVVLIEGPTGSGKNYYAKKIHAESKTAHRPFVQINIASLSESIFESEMFGHVKGAFTGAISDKVGFCERARNGTLFIDEIGELSLQLQAKLLTLIEDRLYYPVGSTTPKEFNGRFILASNKNIEKMVETAEFREDLYYRIRYYNLKLPKLYKNDQLGQIIKNEYNQQLIFSNRFHNRFMNRKTIEILEAYSWPGNYRELKQTISYILETGELPSWVSASPHNKNTKEKSFDYYTELENFEKSFLSRCMEHMNGRINRTAQITGLSKPTLISKLKKYDIDRRLYNVNHLQEAG